MNEEVGKLHLTKNKKNTTINKTGINQLSFMILISIIIQVTSLLKTSITASKFGVSLEIDALNFTNSIGGFIFSFVSSGITTILIPNIIKKKNIKSINSFITLVYSILIITIFIIIIFKKELIMFISGRSEEFVLIADKLMMITLMSQFAVSILGVTDAIFQCNEKFNTPKLLMFITNILLVIILFLDRDLNIYKYSTYICIISILNLMLNILFVKKLDFKFNIVLDLKDNYFRKLLRDFMPIIMSTGLYQITLMTDTMLASRIGEGNISILSYTNSINSILNTLLLSNIVTFLYPKIISGITKREENGDSILFKYCILLSSIMFLVVAGVILVGKDGIALLYERGKFDSSITDLVFICLVISVLSLPVNAMRDLVYRYFYSLNDTLTPFKNSVLISILNLIVSIILSRIIGIYGIILGTVITSYISLINILRKFNKKYSLKYSINEFIIENIKILLSTIVVVFIVSKIKVYLFDMGHLVNLIINGIIIVILYILLLFLTKSIVFKIKI